MVKISQSAARNSIATRFAATGVLDSLTANDFFRATEPTRSFRAGFCEAESEESFEKYVLEEQLELIGNSTRSGAPLNTSNSDGGYVSPYLRSLRVKREVELGPFVEIARSDSPWNVFLHPARIREERMARLENAQHRARRLPFQSRTQALRLHDMDSTRSSSRATKSVHDAVVALVEGETSLPLKLNEKLTNGEGIVFTRTVFPSWVIAFVVDIRRVEDGGALKENAMWPCVCTFDMRRDSLRGLGDLRTDGHRFEFPVTHCVQEFGSSWSPAYPTGRVDDHGQHAVQHGALLVRGAVPRATISGTTMQHGLVPKRQPPLRRRHMRTMRWKRQEAKLG
jgi:hypothetical protein